MFICGCAVEKVVVVVAEVIPKTKISIQHFLCEGSTTTTN